MSGYLEELFSLRGRVALVTGGSSGIGRTMASALGRSGARVVVVARRQDALAETVAELTAQGVEAVAVSADLGRRHDVWRAAAEAVDAFGEPDILVTAAAVNHRPPMDALTLEEWDATLELNLTAPFLLGQRFGTAMADRGWGRIIHVASQQAVRAYLNSGAYGASKGGVVALTRSQAEAWSSRGVTCNAVAPGVVRTPLTAPVFADEEKAAAMAARTMIGRNGEPEDYAGVAVFLASEAAAYVTGQTVFVDGGFSVH
ncbi:SDR family NAD(P)-dependent oxidoreductase [Cryptosporangium phraense]|uniref:SDR family oxidoreductase n=1 Tax=Cryptosporangium phraense TaxID=2593070 RepID=A0A545AZK6_9ACTN|nr:SDR family oxidoreductase [Cryptosporangium phraense]TQS46734.1 SDR family oxidoreductase [Cryptosporangium phraense]